LRPSGCDILLFPFDFRDLRHTRAAVFGNDGPRGVSLQFFAKDSLEPKELKVLN
jgi:hypothetical protein